MANPPEAPQIKPRLESAGGESGGGLSTGVSGPANLSYGHDKSDKALVTVSHPQAQPGSLHATPPTPISAANEVQNVTAESLPNKASDKDVGIDYVGLTKDSQTLSESHQIPVSKELESRSDVPLSGDPAPDTDFGRQQTNGPSSIPDTVAQDALDPGQSTRNDENGVKQFYCLGRKVSPTGKSEVIEETLTESELLNLKLSPDIKQYVIFLPRINDILEPEKAHLQLSAGFHAGLVKRFGINDFFLSETGYKSNGFFLGHHQSNGGKVLEPNRFGSQQLSCKTHGCRFLIKELSPILYPDLLEEQRATARDICKVPQKLRVDMSAVSDDSGQSLVRSFAVKWARLNTTNLLNLDQNTSPTDLQDFFMKWLQDSHTSCGSTKEYEKLYQDVDEILLRLHHALNCACERQEKKKKKEVEQVPELRETSNETSNLTSQSPSHDKGNASKLLPPQDDTERQSHEAAPVPREKSTTQYWLRQLTQVLRIVFMFSQGNVTTKASSIRSTEVSITKMPMSKPPPQKATSVYHWLFLSFWTVIYSSSQDGGGKMSSTTDAEPCENIEILLCFDDANSGKIQDKVRAALQEELPRHTSSVCSGLLPHLVEEVVHFYDNALWQFRVPVRQVEKRRLRIETSSQAGETKDEDDQNQNHRLKNYFNMHELSRHLIHSQETLNAAKNTLGAIVGSRLWEDSVGIEVFRFCHAFVNNLELRAKAFVDRLSNEIELELHIDSVSQLERMDKLLQENRRDGKEVTKFVGYASMLFLPGTFISVSFPEVFLEQQSPNEK